MMGTETSIGDYPDVLAKQLEHNRIFVFSQLEGVIGRLSSAVVKLLAANDARMPFDKTELDEKLNAASKSVQNEMAALLGSIEWADDRLASFCGEIENHAKTCADRWVEGYTDAIVAREVAKEIAHGARKEAEALIARRLAHSQAHPDTRQRVWSITDGHCWYCDVKLIWQCSEMTETCSKDYVFHIDHIVPKTCGGPDHISNFIPACAGCNTSKSDKPFAEFVGRRQRLRLVAGGVAQ